MRKALITTLIFAIHLTLAQAQPQLPKVVSGKIVRIENFQSEYVTSRNVDIWLPDGYSNSEKYAVLYMHDGQMLYDPDHGWNKQSWDVDDAVSDMLQSKTIKKTIVVGIWNGGETRHPDYFPEEPYNTLSKTEKETVSKQLQNKGRIEGIFQPKSDDYLKFLVKELKPYIDKNYSVLTDKANTHIMGSSMGGLISMYAICEYPNVFGSAACLSTHWVGSFTLENNPVPQAFINYLGMNLPNPESNRIYFDCGDQTLDALYPDIQKRVDSVMIAKKFGPANWSTKYFPGENHTEDAWKKRLKTPLEFLLRDWP